MRQQQAVRRAAAAGSSCRCPARRWSAREHRASGRRRAAAPPAGTASSTSFFEHAASRRNCCLLLDTLEEAAGFPTGDLRAGFCPACGFITNMAFDGGRVLQRYEETQGFSQAVRQLRRTWPSAGSSRYDLAGQVVLEIGCGKGEFLDLDGRGRRRLAASASTPASPRTHRLAPRPTGSTLIEDFYSEGYAHLGGRRRRLPAHARAHRSGRRLHGHGAPRHRRPARDGRALRAARRASACSGRWRSGTSTTSSARSRCPRTRPPRARAARRAARRARPCRRSPIDRRTRRHELADRARCARACAGRRPRRRSGGRTPRSRGRR